MKNKATTTETAVKKGTYIDAFLQLLTGTAAYTAHKDTLVMIRVNPSRLEIYDIRYRDTFHHLQIAAMIFPLSTILNCYVTKNSNEFIKLIIFE